MTDRSPCRTYRPTEASLTWAELTAVRAAQIELGASKVCRACGERKHVGAFPGYGAAQCSACAGLEAWAA